MIITTSIERTKAMTIEIKFSRDFRNASALLDYFNVSPMIAESMVEKGHSGWLRVNVNVAAHMRLDPRFNGIELRPSESITDASWFALK